VLRAGGLMEKRLLKRDEVAERLNVSTRTVDRLLDSGELPAVHVRSAVRIDPKAVEELVRRGQEPNR
jgi:excisionase family DNA binding protein